MVKNLPDKWVRKSVFDAINNIVVNGFTIPCYDTRVTNNNVKDHYILMTTQTNSVNKSNKCEYSYESSILLDIITTYKSVGNTGSRTLADDILNKVRELTNDLTLDGVSGLYIIWQKQDFPNDIATITDTENVFRKFMRIEFFIN